MYSGKGPLVRGARRGVSVPRGSGPIKKVRPVRRRCLGPFVGRVGMIREGPRSDSSLTERNEGNGPPARTVERQGVHPWLNLPDDDGLSICGVSIRSANAQKGCRVYASSGRKGL